MWFAQNRKRKTRQKKKKKRKKRKKRKTRQKKRKKRNKRNKRKKRKKRKKRNKRKKKKGKKRKKRKKKKRRGKGCLFLVFFGLVEKSSSLEKWLWKAEGTKNFSKERPAWKKTKKHTHPPPQKKTKNKN